MSNFQKQGLSNTNCVETVAENNRKNKNKKNDAKTEFFTSILQSTYFKYAIIVANMTAVAFCIAMLFVVVLSTWFVCKTDGVNRLDIALDVLYRVGVPCIALVIFFIKFGESKYNM